MSDTNDFLVTKGPDSMGHTSETHPSYGVIGVSRVSGQTPLFDSDVIHGHFIQITLQECEKVRSGFTHEYTHGHRRLMQINMSFAQFAQMITTQNVGDGVPCTIAYVKGDESEPWANKWGGRPEPPNPKPFLDKFKAVAKDRAERILANIDAAMLSLKKLLDGTDRPTKANMKTAADKLDSVRRDVQSNLPYLMECMDEELEHKLSNAVTEFESYVSASLQEKGLEVMREETIRLSIGQQKNLAAPTESA